MPKFIIEREAPGIGSLSAEQLENGARNSCEVIKGMGPQIQWVHSYITGDKAYCVYIAETEELIRTHAEKAGIPANRVSEVKGILDPTRAGLE
ncbi:TPA: DUF4242 domain-containing protein [Candidatus Latescibacteria bacterium]|nr:DUF4242 domain-containing protein [Candidatus Latescibacterota bacterium]|tara:strand:- start:1355 stop:1633 length:279 start_codon:yes stop_codon:yes gene_type:complete